VDRDSDTHMDEMDGMDSDEEDDSQVAAQAQAQVQAQALALAQAAQQKQAFGQHGHASSKPTPGQLGGTNGMDKYSGSPSSPKKSTAASGQEFVLQIAATQRMLYHILEKHDALPDRVRLYSHIPIFPYSHIPIIP
jgi:hypothetical protein